MFIPSRNQLLHLLFSFQLTVIFQYQVLKCISQNNYFNLVFIGTNLILAALKGAKKVGLWSSKGFITENNFKIPFKGIDEFIEFDEKFETDMFRKEFVS